MKYYVVWEGVEEGVYTTWEACQQAVEGFSSAKYKSFKTEAEAEEAFEMGYEAYRLKEKKEIEKEKKKEKKKKEESNIAAKDTATSTEAESCTATSTEAESCTATSTEAASCTATSCAAAHPAPQSSATPPPLPPGAINNAIAVDAACSGNPGKMEYRGVYLLTGKEIFHFGPVYGTNNIGEFLAIVHGLALLKQQGLDTMPIYSDSVNAQLWVKRKKCKTTLTRNEKTEKLYLLIERAERWLKTNTYANPIIKWPTEEWGEIPADFGRK